MRPGTQRRGEDLSSPLRISALFETDKVRPPSMMRTMTSLAEPGLVERTANPDDGTQVLVSLLQRIAGA